jgi:hypothetical protein
MAGGGCRGIPAKSKNWKWLRSGIHSFINFMKENMTAKSLYYKHIYHHDVPSDNVKAVYTIAVMLLLLLQLFFFFF